MTEHISQFSVELWAPAGGETPPPTVTPSTGTFTFDGGQRQDWMLLLQPSDSGDPLRTKLVKAFNVIGRMTNPQAMVYKWDVLEGIDVDDAVDGLNSATGAIDIPSTTEVTQTRRYQVNVTNAAQHSLRLSGTWDASVNSAKDQIHRIVYELASWGIRR